MAANFDVDENGDPVGTEKKKPGRKATYASPAEKQKAYRARLGTRSLAVQIDPQTFDELQAYMSRMNADGAALTVSQVISKLLKTQLLRKR